MLPYNKSLTQNARELRKNMTPEEKHLWYDFLKRLPFPVKRQKNICNYIVDFYIPSAKLVIEIDGRQHLTEEHLAADMKRDKALQSMGIAVKRYTNDSINNHFRLVTMEIMQILGLDNTSLPL